MKLEQKLVEGKWLSQLQLDQALAETTRSGGSLWSSLVRLGYLSEDEIIKFFACESGIPFVSPSVYRVDETLFGLLEADFCIQNRVFPLFRIGDRIYVACSNPFNSSVLDSLARMSGMEIEPLFSTASSIRKAQESYWRYDEKMFEAQQYLTSSQKRLLGVGFSRAAQRLSLDIPVDIWGETDSFRLASGSGVEARTRDISQDASAVCCAAAVFLPPQLGVRLLFRLPQGDVKTGGEVVNCRIEQTGVYYIGILLKELGSREKEILVGLAH